MEAVLRLTVEVEGTVTGSVSIPPSTTGNSCFWTISIDIVHGDGRLEEVWGFCVQEPMVVPTGVRVLDLSLGAPIDMPPSAGDRLAISVATFGTRSPGATVDLLSGTTDSDSTFLIQGLQVPIDTQTLLQ
jgi:hypothetical protein